MSETLSVVIPVYNEERVVGTVIKKWVETLDGLDIKYQVHVYNDGSTDNTLKVIEDVSKKIKNVFYRSNKNSGHGPTILKGFRDRSCSDWIFQIDSDDEMGPESFSQLWRNREKFDFLCGKRVGRGQTLARKLLSYISRVTVSLIYEKGISDVNVPYRLYRVSPFKEYFFKLPEDTFAPNVILTGIACHKGLRLFETPVKFKTRTTGEVSLKKFNLLKSAIASFLQTVLFRTHL